MALTKAQSDAIAVRGRAVLVSAAAGSGKTYTLTKRIIDSIISDESKSLSRMLIVTFTRSAAADLKKKISDALSDAIAAHPDNIHLKDELLKLGSSHISTIDSFFSAPVKANFEKLGLPASMRLADDAELASLRESVMRETLEQFFNEYSGISEGELASVGHSSNYTDLLRLISGIRDTSGLIPTLLSIYSKTLTGPLGVESLKKSSERLLASAELDFFETEEGKALQSDLEHLFMGTSLQLHLLRDEVLTLANEKIADSPSDPPKYATALKEQVYPLFDEDGNTCRNLLETTLTSYTELHSLALSTKFSGFPSLRGEKRSGYSESYMAARNRQLKPIKAALTYYAKYSPRELWHHFTLSAAISGVLYDLLSEFDRRYSAEKLSRGICEFSDMPKFMLQLLQNPDGSLTDTAKAMQKQFDEVYIDEYQDVNAIQDKIFEIIGGDRRFMVGDIKQSIYCFRDAEPSIFASYRQSFTEYDSDYPDLIPQNGSSIFMSENFRCDEGIINFANTVCGDIFFSFAESIGYDEESDKLRFGKIGDRFDPPKSVTVNLIEPAENQAEEDGEEAAPEPPESDENEDKLYDEAVVCANEIARLIRDKNEKNADGSKLCAGDIAILVRGNGQIDPIAEVLSKIGIKYVTNAKNALLDGNEMKLLADLLTVIDNPREDIPLCRVLTSSLPCYSPLLTLDEVATVKCVADPKASLFDAVIGYSKVGDDNELKEKCLSLVTLLDSFRRLSARISADKLLRALSREDRFAKLCESDAFTYLYTVACRYVKGAWNGLYSFIVYFKGLMEKGSGASEPIKAQRDEVTIITMHQSKGLEFKVCFLFGLAKEFNMRDLQKPLIFNRELGISMKLPNIFGEENDLYGKTQVGRVENLLWRAAVTLAKNKQLEEEARVYYVALTRAKERLYLSATLNKSYESIMTDLLLEGRDFVNEIRSGKSYIFWTIVSLLPHRTNEELFKVNTFKRGAIPPLADRLTREEVDSSAYGITDEDKSFASYLLSPHGVTEEEKLAALIPAKVAASKVSPTMLDESIFSSIPSGDLFAESDEDAGEQEPDGVMQIRRRIEIMKSRKTDFDSLLEVNKRPTAAEKGSAAHLVLQYCDYERVAKSGLDAEIARLVSEKFITKRASEIVDRGQLAGFFDSELFALIRGAKKYRREFRFGLFRSAADFTENSDRKRQLGDKKIFVQGSIDLLLETESGIILCDYKTDKITDDERADRALLVKNMQARHAGQLDAYRFAVEAIFGKKPFKVYIYSIPLGEVIEI